MKALVISESDESVQEIHRILISSAFDLIRYRSAVKALDNIQEIMPDAVFINTSDFPRHWKTLVQFIRADRDRAEVLIVLLVSDRFTPEDADKATFIGVNAILEESLKSEEERYTLTQLFDRYGMGLRNFQARSLNFGDRAVFMFTNPLTGTIITGQIEGLTTQEMRFRPDVPSATSDLAAGEILDQCSLKLDKSILSPRCLILSNSSIMRIEFINLSSKNTSDISLFIDEPSQKLAEYPI